MHLLPLLLLLLLAWSVMRPLRRRIVTLEQEVAGQRDQSLRQQQAVDTMLSQLKDMVVRMDRQGRVLWANPRAKEKLPLPMLESSAPNDGLHDVLSMMQMQRDPDWGQRLHQALQRLPELSVLPKLHMNDNGSGNILSFSLQLLPLGDDQALLLCNDITQSLRQQQQKDALFANLMHDLKTPLTSLIGYSDTLTTLGDNKQVREEAGAAISRAAKRVNRLLDGLMALSSHGFDAQGQEMVGCSASVVVHLVLDGIQDVARARQVQVELQMDASLEDVVVAMAADSCERMLFNVVENGVNHAPVESVVQVRVRSDGAMLRIEVADHGCGVAKENIPRLTERFYRLDSSRSQGGHGLGLAIVAEHLKQCGGELTIRNNLPTGLLVTMKVPFAVA